MRSEQQLTRKYLYAIKVMNQVEHNQKMITTQEYHFVPVILLLRSAFVDGYPVFIWFAVFAK